MRGIFRHIRVLFVFLVIAMVAPALGLAQEVAEAAVVADEVLPQWAAAIIAVLAAVAGSGLLSAFISSNKWWMQIIDAVALNWGKARNDSRDQ